MKGKRIIADCLQETVFGDLVISQYSAIPFSLLISTVGGIVIGAFFGTTKLIKDVVQITFLCVAMGAISGVVTFLELILHADLLRAIWYGVSLTALNILFNAVGIGSVGLLLILPQKISSVFTERSEKKKNAQRNRMKGG